MSGLFYLLYVRMHTTLLYTIYLFTRMMITIALNGTVSRTNLHKPFPPLSPQKNQKSKEDVKMKKMVPNFM